MRRSRAIQLVVWFGLAPAAVSCAQLTGLTDDYHLASAGAGAQATTGSSGSAGAATQGGSSGHTRDDDEAGASGDSNAAGDSGIGAQGGDQAVAGRSGSSGFAGNSSGGASGNSSSAGNSGSAGNSSAGNSSAGNGSSGAGGHDGGAGSSSGGTAGSGVAGSGGSGTSTATRIGFSMFHDSAFGNDDASSHLANATFSKPSGTSAGDLIFVFFGADHSLKGLSGNTLSSLGWTLLDQHSDYGTDGQATYLIYKFAGSNEPDPIVFTGINPTPSGNGVQGLLSVYRGVNPSNPVNAYQFSLVTSGMNGTQVVTATPAITTTVANCLLIAGLSPDTTIDKPVIDAWPQGFDENLVSVINAPNPYPLGWANIYSAERHLPVAGTVPASSFHWTMTNDAEGGNYFGSLSFVLALAPKP